MKCSCCSKYCCLFTETLQQLRASIEDDTLYEVRAAIRSFILEVRRLGYYGTDPSTFLTCEGCYKDFCPDCISRCPDPLCHTLECSACRGTNAKFTKCDWHPSSGLTESSPANASEDVVMESSGEGATEVSETIE